MQATDVIFPALDLCHRAFEFSTHAPGFFCQENAPSMPEVNTNLPHLQMPKSDFQIFETRLQLIISLFSLFCSIVLCFNFIRLHRREESQWTTDQINVCLIPLVLSMTFAVLYFVFR